MLVSYSYPQNSLLLPLSKLYSVIGEGVGGEVLNEQDQTSIMAN